MELQFDLDPGVRHHVEVRLGPQVWVWSSVAFKCEVIRKDGSVGIGGAPAFGTFQFTTSTSVRLVLTNMDYTETASFYVSAHLA